MARIRSIKPTFFRSRSVKRLTADQKLVWIGLWPLADDEGRLMDETGILVGDLWALSISESKLDKTLDQLDDAGRIIRYEVAGQAYIQVTNWTEHQKINRPTPSLFPPAPLTNHSGRAHASLSESSLLEGKGEERKGGEAPPLFCSAHPKGGAGKCGACGDARRLRAAWDLEQKNKPTPTTPVRLDPNDGHEHEKHPTENYCLRCDEVMA
jgi:hypothetical protein